jgi:uncharacterized membrane protein YhfC
VREPFRWSVALALALSALVATAGPPIAAIAWSRRTGARAKHFALGAGTFFVSQCVLRLPWQIALGVWLQPKLAGHVGLQAAWLAASAATASLFEEGGRALTIRWLVTDERSFRAGVMLGLGHGGFESMLLVGLSMAANVALYLLLGLGVPTGLPPDAVAKIVPVLAAVTPSAALAGGVERALTVPFHVGCSALVMEGFRRGAVARWLAAALSLHFSADFLGVAGAAWITRHAGSPLAGELAIVPFSAVAVAIVLGLERRAPVERAA